MFSCKTRGFCPSCHAKRREEWGGWMREELLLDVPHRQVVFTVPKMLRLFFRFKRKLLNSLCLCAVRSLVKFLYIATGLEIMPGVEAVIQAFGDRINFHPHIHVLVTEGGTASDGTFHRVSSFRDEVIQEIFTHEVFSLLLRKKLIGLPLMQKILSWRHTGFNVHGQVRAQTTNETERVGKGLGWDGVIRKAYEVGPLGCPSCGGQMSMISFIKDPKAIDMIIAHLELAFEAKRPPPPHHAQQELLRTAEEKGECF